MSDRPPANELVFEQIRQWMSDGEFWPGARLDPAAIAQAFNTTQTEVQFALQRLVGAGLLVDDPRHRLRALAFKRIKRALQYGRYRPGEALEPAAMAQVYGTGPGVVRFALYRLLGEEVIERGGTRGFKVPSVDESTLRDHYGFAQWCTSLAFDLLARRAERPEPAAATVDADTNGDLTAQTVQFFEEIAHAAGNGPMEETIGRMNSLLGPVRPVEIALIVDAAGELSNLQEAWQRRDFKALSTALSAYVDHRRRLAPRIAELLTATPGTC